MKKILLLSAFAFSTMGFAQEQVILSENFTSYPAGNFGTDMTGATAGVGGWYTYGGTGAVATNFQVGVIDLAHGNSAKIQSGNGYTASNNPNNRFLFKPTTGTATAANNILHATFRIYTGPATGAGDSRVVIYSNDTDGNAIAGIRYDYATKKMFALATLEVTSTSDIGFYNIALGAQTFPANSWITCTLTYNKTTGAPTWSYTDGTPANTGSYSLTLPTGYAYVPGLNPLEIDLINITATGNTVANQSGFDDIIVKFSNATLLGVDDLKDNASIENQLISVYPNPTTDILNIKTKDKLKSVSVFDMSGKKMDVKLNGTSVDVKALRSGAYMISVETNKESQSLKFIKK
ncbi:T9SS type A sorting domain-containing protein [Amniculibacterium sp. G2-70]|uniref:T9SS type A sorting domain-containing protein n=1 Tax=Amniculibacterium sp. G2-70 TaxID=2767188 RepID=UPI001654273B|nr:T9SS type A sorting domain-containing protein [Amniculibacterium sp. G2-70]